jgi:RNA polymerase sigma-70 factor (ECF subfamily)
MDLSAHDRQHRTAEDRTQDAFVQAWRSLPTPEQRSRFGTWLHRIAVNAAGAGPPSPGALRTRLRRVGSEPADPCRNPAPCANRPRSPDCPPSPPGAGARGPLRLLDEETASMLGIAVGTCKAQLHLTADPERG